MPVYTFKCNDNGDIYEKEMKMSELDDYKDNNNVSTVVGTPTFLVRKGDGKDLYARSDGDFKSRMKNLKKQFPKADSLKDW